MAVSHKTNNLINCSRCHLPFNFKNAVPKLLPCKHWYCFNCLENLIHKTTNDTQQIFCIQCQKSLNLQGLQNNTENIQTQYKILKPQLQLQSQNHNTNNNNNNTQNTTTSFGCEEEFGLKDFETDNDYNKTRSASLTSDNSIGSLFYFNNEAEGNFNLMGNCSAAVGGGGTGKGLEKMSPGENCFIHGMPNTLWCNTCMIVLCRGCNSGAEHKDHKIKNQLEAKECYQEHIKQEFIQIQETLGNMENLKLLQKEFLLKILETCCSLKLQIEDELVATTNTIDIDEMKESIKNLQLCLDLLGKQTPNDILKLYKVIKDENLKFKTKQKQMLQQYKMQQLLTKSARIVDFDIIKQIVQKFENQEFANNLNDELLNDIPNRENNSMMILTNYCIYRLYCTYIKQQQQFVEEQFLRYQQYHQEQKQNLIKQFKMLQQHQAATPSSTYQNHGSNNNNNHHHHHHQNHHLQQNTTVGTTNNDLRRVVPNYYTHDKNKPKTYAEIATTETIAQYHDNTTNTALDVVSTNFQPYKKPSVKHFEESRKTVNLLFNPINNDNNQIYYFDFEKNSEPVGRILIKVFSDLAPKMSYNFQALTTHEKGFGYSGCKVFECHPNESIITGDIEQNTGYSSRSIYEDVQFVPDDTNIAPFAGAVGMRRAKKKFDSQGLVGSQFRIILTELGFTAIFGCVIEGLDVVKKISQSIVQNDKMHCSNGVANGAGAASAAVPAGACGVGSIFIAQCGLYEFVKRDILGGI